jgi:hypothetical protein
MGCGVTGWTRDDALAISRERIPEDLDATVGCIEDVDVSTLDPRHILPNTGDVTVRGIWFPFGFVR